MLSYSSDSFFYFSPSRQSHSSMKITIPAHLLIEVAKFCAKGSVRPACATVHIDIDEESKKITLASTDSYRLHEVTTDLVERPFPQYKSFFLTEEIKQFDVMHQSLVDNCKQAKTVNKSRPGIKLGKEVQVRGEDERWYTIPSGYSNDHEDIIVNATFLLDILKQAPKGEKVFFRVSDPLKPLQIEWTGARHIIMPLKK